MSEWPHAPIHKLQEGGTFMVTSGTYYKRHYLYTKERLTLLRDELFAKADEFGWHLQAWSVLANHYHFVAVSPTPADAESLTPFVKKLHEQTAHYLNSLDKRPGRRVWYQFWDTKVTYQKSYLARLNYVHNNPAHHNIAKDASQYPWCSMNWFRQTAPSSFKRTVESFKTDKLNVYDDF